MPFNIHLGCPELLIQFDWQPKWSIIKWTKGLVDIVGSAGEQNIQGEDQQKMDVYANEVLFKP
jgi:fructose-1,6-bisphosphatase